MNSLRVGCLILGCTMIVLPGLLLSGCKLAEVPTEDRRPNAFVKLPALQREIVGQWDDRQTGTESVADIGLADDQILPPRTPRNGLPEEFHDLTLDQAILIALQDTAILRTLGARVLQSPEFASTQVDPAIQASDPLFGTAAALSEFDARIRSTLNYANNDDVFNNPNNPLLGSGATEVQQDLSIADWGVTRIGPAGTRYSLATELLHDNNNSPNNLFDSSWRWQAEATVRKPLLQGSGVAFNQIAGPNATPGLRFSNGLLLARIDTDISLVQFTQDVRDYVVTVINAYWELHEAYQRYAAALVARDAAYDTWMSVRSRFENDLPGGEADSEAQSEEQYLEFQGRVLDALGSDNSAFPGVLQAEANLRRLLGLPQTAQEFLRPVDQPLQAPVRWDWYAVAHEAIANRAEIRQQLKRVRRGQLELIAARNFTLPELDAVATWRNNGFGNDLTGNSGGRFRSAARDALSGDHDEWEFGLQYNMPLGFRRERTSVRNAELELRRERIVLEEQQKAVLHDLGTAVRQVDRGFESLEVARQRFEAARRTVQARTASWEADLATIVELLESQRRAAAAETDWYRRQREYTESNVRVLRESGRLLASLSILVDDCDGSVQCEWTGTSSLMLETVGDPELDYRVAPAARRPTRPDPAELPRDSRQAPAERD